MRGLLTAFHIRANVTVPIRKRGELVAALSISHTSPRSWEAHEVELVREIALRCWPAIERGRTEDALHESQARLEEELKYSKLLQHLSLELVQEKDTAVLLPRILDLATELMDAQFASLQVLDPEPGQSGELKLLASKGFNQESITYWDRASLCSSCACGEALRRQARVIVEDVDVCSFIRGTKDQQVFAHNGIRACQTTPLITTKGMLVGMLSTYWSEPHLPSSRQLFFFDMLASQAANSIERRQYEEALNKSEQKALALVGALEEADRNKNQFLYALSHELRNPLAVIMAGVELLCIQEDKKQAAATTEVLYRQIKHLCALVDDLLDLTRISQNRIMLYKEHTELCQLVAIAAQDYRELFLKKGIGLRMKISTGPLYLMADPVRIRQIVGNLLHNAQKFTPKGGETVISVYQKKHEAVISVKDNGIGIDPQMLPRLFRPFVQADTSLERSNGGLGLGLSIVKEIVQLHGGTVSVFSGGLGKGAEFLVRFPLAAWTGFEEPAGGQQALASAGPLKTLIIEDNRDFAGMMQTILTTLGCKTEVAFDGTDGLQKAKSFRPDILFCDIGLPGKNGYEIAQAIRADEALKQTFLVALTGYAGEEDARRARESGFNLHMAKPADLAVLRRIISEYPGRGMGDKCLT